MKKSELEANTVYCAETYERRWTTYYLIVGEPMLTQWGRLTDGTRNGTHRHQFVDTTWVVEVQPFNVANDGSLNFWERKRWVTPGYLKVRIAALQPFKTAVATKHREQQELRREAKQLSAALESIASQLRDVVAGSGQVDSDAACIRLDFGAAQALLHKVAN